jgi:micrococcal nuclease
LTSVVLLGKILQVLSSWYRDYSKDYEFGQAEIYARRNKLGLWSDLSAIPPWDFRKTKSTTKKKPNKK